MVIGGAVALWLGGMTTTASATGSSGGFEYARQAAVGGVQYGDALGEPRPVPRQTGVRLKPDPTRPGRARLIDGIAHAPAGAPKEVAAAIEAGNRLQGKPYRYGGGHGDFEDTAYDCSGTVSYVLHAGGLLNSPLDSGSLEKFGSAGPGRWMTIYANRGHTYIVIAGLRLDTSRISGSAQARAAVRRRRDAVERGTGPLWQEYERPSGDFTVRHPNGL